MKIDQKVVTKFVGITGDEDPSWNSHVVNVITSVSRGVVVLCKVSSCIPRRTLIIMYNLIVVPYISYFNVV